MLIAVEETNLRGIRKQVAQENIFNQMRLIGEPELNDGILSIEDRLKKLGLNE